MAKQIQGLANFIWVYPGRPNPYGITVETRKAYNPLTGELLSVREAQTRAHGGLRYEQRVPKEQRKLYRERDPRTQAIIRDYRRAVKRTTGRDMSYDEIVRSREFRQLLSDLRRPANSPRGKKARALVDLGRRESWWDWNVGDTPEDLMQGVA
ncbi:MAG: hypothetical protein IRZ31_20105 [Thermogemmatispora sp.]|jgi:hypothetical protein|uniref:hypothetical protein n=1 Tax=Thermogemmatispora sp. TaxID=1968838 RepID=UPI00262DE83F|nr:hypothetical protein [Thermogemmatispora sp.]MBX5459203.1 hypothetical protein [Thermogemmatispora sp.]